MFHTYIECNEKNGTRVFNYCDAALNFPCDFRFGISTPVFVTPVRNYVVPGFLIFRFFSEDFQSFFYFFAYMFGFISLEKNTKAGTTRLGW